jgi:opacity protein-like surface antigen
MKQKNYGCGLMGREDMKHIASGVVALLFLLSASGPARAEEEVKAVAGFKTWINSWKSEQQGSESMKSSYNALVGWAAEAEFTSGVFVEASYLMSVSDYKFDQNAVATDVKYGDLILAIGYRFHHRFDFFAGYRSSQFWERLPKSKTVLSGPLLGVQGTAPLKDAFSLFVNLTYFPLSNKKTVGEINEKETVRGQSAEAGVRYAFTKGASGALGYRYETTEGEKTRIEDTFAGPTIDVMFYF